MRMKPPPWGNEETQKILDILEKHNIKATFFVTGEWVRKYPKDVKKIAEAGHDLGNYSEHYKNMKGLSEEECRREIMEVHQKVKALTGVEMNLFRCPHGEYDNEMMKNVTNCGYYPIQWSVDSLDWKDYGAESIIQTVCDHTELKNGAIILMRNGAKYTADSLEQMILEIQKKGFQIVPVSELIYYENDHMDEQRK